MTRPFLLLAALFSLLASPANAEWACRSYDLGLGGIEDVAVDEAHGTLLFSAYDRRAVEEAMSEDAESVPSGGLFRLSLESLRSEDTPIPERLAWPGGEDDPLRPHGIDFHREGEEATLFAVQRAVVREEESWVLRPRIEILKLDARGLSRRRPPLEDSRVCSPNDVAALDLERFLVTNDRGECSGLSRRFETWFGLPWGRVYAFDGQGLTTLADDIAFPNGILAEPGSFLVAATRADAIERRSLPGGTLEREFPLEMSPDNLGRGSDRRIYIAGYPSLFEFALFRGGWSDRSPTRVVSLDPGTGEVRLELEDEGALISGASVALRHEDLLILGAAFDPRLAICEETR